MTGDTLQRLYADFSSAYQNFLELPVHLEDEMKKNLYIPLKATGLLDLQEKQIDLIDKLKENIFSYKNTPLFDNNEEFDGTIGPNKGAIVYGGPGSGKTSTALYLVNYYWKLLNGVQSTNQSCSKQVIPIYLVQHTNHNISIQNLLDALAMRIAKASQDVIKAVECSNVLIVVQILGGCNTDYATKIVKQFHQFWISTASSESKVNVVIFSRKCRPNVLSDTNIADTSCSQLSEFYIETLNKQQSVDQINKFVNLLQEFPKIAFIADPNNQFSICKENIAQTERKWEEDCSLYLYWLNFSSVTASPFPQLQILTENPLGLQILLRILPTVININEENTNAFQRLIDEYLDQWFRHQTQKMIKSRLSTGLALAFNSIPSYCLAYCQNFALKLFLQSSKEMATDLALNDVSEVSIDSTETLCADLAEPVFNDSLHALRQYDKTHCYLFRGNSNDTNDFTSSSSQNLNLQLIRDACPLVVSKTASGKERYRFLQPILLRHLVKSVLDIDEYRKSNNTEKMTYILIRGETSENTKSPLIYLPNKDESFPGIESNVWIVSKVELIGSFANRKKICILLEGMRHKQRFILYVTKNTAAPLETAQQVMEIMEERKCVKQWSLRKTECLKILKTIDEIYIQKTLGRLTKLSSEEWCSHVLQILSGK